MGVEEDTAAAVRGVQRMAAAVAPTAAEAAELEDAESAAEGVAAVTEDAAYGLGPSQSASS